MLAFELIAQGFLSMKHPCSIVDMIFKWNVVKSGTFSFIRSLETVFVILAVWWNLLFCKIYYATMSTSKFGFIRDYLTVGFARLLGRRTVLHLHGGGFKEFYMESQPWLQRLICSNLKRIDVIIVLGDLLKEQFYCTGEFVKPKFRVVPNGLTLGVREPEWINRKLPADRPIELLYLSSLMPSKGFFTVIQAVELLEQQSPGKFHLNLCGVFVDAKTESKSEICSADALEDYIEKNSLEKAVTYHGQVLSEAKEDQFKNAHVFLLPTNYPWEGQPLSIIEALAYSLPVVTCKHKGIPELIDDGKNGIFVEPGNPAAIASAVNSIVADTDPYSSMSKASRHRYEKNFRREAHLKQLIAVIMDIREADVPPLQI